MLLARLKSRKLWLVLAVLAVLTFFYIKGKKGTEYTPYTVASRDIVESLSLSGKVEATSSATLRFLTGGYVTYLGAKEGDTIKKWQTLATLDSRQLQKVLDQKLNLYAIQRGTFDQTVDDNDNSVPDGDLARELSRLLAKNQYQLDNTVLDVEYQDLAVKLARLTSPLTGILVHAPTSVANVQVSSTDTWVVVDPSSLEFVADLDETDLQKVQVGQPATLTLDAFPDNAIHTVVSRVSYSPKETTTGTTYEVHIAVPKDSMSTLRLGLNGTAELELEKKGSVPTLPQEAVSYESKGPVVYLKEGRSYTAKSLELGIDDGENVEIVKGAELGTVVYAKKVE